MQKEDILAEIRRTALENNGKPLGVARFGQVTGIRPYDWVKHWPRFSQAIIEAGFEPNKLTGSFPDEYLFDKMASLTRELGRFPTQNDLVFKRVNDTDFPNKDVFRRLGNKDNLVRKVLSYCRSKQEYSDIVQIIEAVPLVSNADNMSGGETGRDDLKYGFVYLVKGHPGEYKIGRTNLVDRRLSELGAKASIQQSLVHEIKTDDPAGIEAYWHKRFQDKRMRGEWFKLSAADVKAFRRWRKIF